MTLTLGMEKRMKGWPGEPQMEYDVLMADGNAAANAGRQITDVIFDFGNVLIYWDPAAVMTPRYSDGLVEQFLDNDVSGFYDINNELDDKEIDSWIRLTRVLTHEIMNAVTPITSLSDTLLKLTEARISKEEMRHGLQTISTTGKGLLAFVESYRRFTRIPTPEPSLFYLKGFINRMAELARHQYPDTPVTFNVSIVPDDLILYADENLISQVIINLLKNAIQAFETGAPAATGTNAETTAETNAATTEKHINIRAYCNEAEAVLIEISNNGPAIPPDIAGHIFIPFFTTKENGSGIGLSISRQIMRLSGGSLSLIAGKETTFVLKFN